MRIIETSQIHTVAPSTTTRSMQAYTGAYESNHADMSRAVYQGIEASKEIETRKQKGITSRWQVLGYIRSLRSLSLSRHLGSPHLIPRIFRKHFEACGLQGRNAISFSTYLFCDVIAEWAKAT